MTLITNSFEGVLPSGTTLTTANTGGASGNAFDTVTVGTGGTAASDSTHAAHGALSAKIATSGSSSATFIGWSTSIGSSSQEWFRLYLYVTGNPSAAMRLWEVLNSGTLAGRLDITTSGKLQIHDSASTNAGITTNTIPLNAWFRVEGYILCSATVGVMEVKLFTSMDSTSPLETLTSSATLNTLTAVNAHQFGLSAGVANQGPYWMDDLGASTVGYIGPVSSGATDPDAALPGLAWQNKFLPERLTKHSVLFDYQLANSASYLNSPGDLTLGATSVGAQGLTVSSAPVIAQPGPAWGNVFGPLSVHSKRPVLFDKATFFSVGVYDNLSGDLTLGAITTGYTQALAGDRSSLSPGPPFRNTFTPSLLRKAPVLWDVQLSNAGKSSGPLTLGAITAGVVSIPGLLPAQPARPGPAWLNVFRGQLTKQSVFYDGVTYPGPFGPFCFTGAEADVNLFGGTQVDTNLYGGTQVDTNLYGGTQVDTNLYGGTQYSGCGLQAVNITLGEFNDETIDLTITNNSVPFNLTGYGLQALFKTAAGVQDTDPSTLILSTGNGAITITNAVNGTATLVIPNADLDNTNFGFWRVDVTIGGTQATAMYGTVTIRAL